MPAAIIGVGSALPETVITNADFADIGADDAWIVKRTGIRERRWLPEDGSLAELAIAASAAALADAGVDPGAVRHVVVATITPDHVTPALAVEVARALGTPHAAAFDLHAACAGFLYALDHAAALVETGRAGHVLVCGAEALSRITDKTDRATAVLLGDGAGAVVVADAPAAARPTFHLATDGELTDLLYAPRHDGLLRMRGREIYDHAVTLMTEYTRNVLAERGLEVKDVDLFIAHQANARILKAVARNLDLPPERLVLTVEKTANTSAASIPIAMAQARADGLLDEPRLLGMAAFGSGITWGAGLMTWQPA
ncbi:3-oxoacyl-ACP synthase III family protein [Actinokineospora sp. 24-640]